MLITIYNVHRSFIPLFATVVLLAYSGHTEIPAVPEDASLEIAEYSSLGVPDPRTEWSAQDYMAALKALATLRAEQLPRRGSARSATLFDRLLVSYRNLFGLEWEGGYGDNADAESVPSLDSIYQGALDDGLYFDSELVEIRAAALARSLETLPSRSELRRLSEGVQAGGGAEYGEASDRLLRITQMGNAARSTILQDASDLLALAGLPTMTEGGRALLVERVGAFFPRLPNHLAKDELRLLAALVKGAANAPANADARRPLLDIARQLEQPQ